MTTAHMQRLSCAMSVEFINDRMVLYATHSNYPERITVLTPEEVIALFDVLKEGCCPVCLVEIPLNDVVCNECFEKAQSTRGG